jgi:serine/threonine-protein kinase
VLEVLDDGLLSSGVAFLVTELLVGETLAQRIRRLGRLDKSEVAQWALQATDALMAIHGAGIIHRDVKPENLFIHSGTSGVERLKLIDFGVAAVSWAETRLTRHGARVGTLGYAAPEQERGDEIDSRADLYALGQTLKEALTGEAPPTDESQQNKAIMGLPSDWSRILNKLTAPTAAERFASARDARDAIAALEGGTAVYGQGVMGESSVPPALMGK